MVLYGSWKRSTLELLRVVGTLRGLDTAACVANLSHCSGCRPAYKGAVRLLGCFGGWVRFNETEAELPLQQIYFRDHKSLYKLCKDIHSFLTVFLDRAGGWGVCRERFGPPAVAESSSRLLMCPPS